MAEQQDDVYDYSMSDTFVSETRPRTYLTGFRSRRHPLQPSLSYINNLCDEEFWAYCRNGCRLPSAGPDVRADLAELRTAFRKCEADVRALRTELQALRQIIALAAQDRPTLKKGGLNVPPRA